MRQTDRRAPTTCAALLLVAGLFAALGTTTTSAEAASSCPDLPGLTPNVWIGTDEDSDHLWRTDDNWSRGVAPGLDDGADGYACIPTGAVRLEGPDDVRKVMALHVARGASLVVDTGSQLFVRGNPDTQPSSIAGELTVNGAAFGGEGRVRLRGTLTWHSEAGGPVATLATRGCALPTPEPPPPTTEPPASARVARWEACDGPDGGHLDGDGGLLVVKRHGQVLVDGAGVSQIDGYRLRVQGTVAVSGEGYVVADRGTSTQLEPSGRYLFQNDGGYYEGAARFGETRLSAFENQGLLEKAGGEGVSAVDATYTQPEGEGEIQIEQGTLHVASGSPVAARVEGGASYGSGECLKVGGSLGCPTRTDADDQQNAMMRVPEIDGDGADVTVSEETRPESLYSIGVPIEVHADGLDATKRDPAILTFRIDDSLLRPAQTWQYIDVLRDSEAPGGYHRVRRCDSDGRPPAGQQACVDRRKIAGVSSRNKNGDVIMVVRAIGTSRWICR